MDLKTLIVLLLDHYSWNEESSKIRELEQLLRELASEAHEAAQRIEDASKEETE